MASLILFDDWVSLQKVFSVVHGKPAGLPSQNPTRSFWTDSSPDANPLAHEGSSGPLTTDADICIIGSGITGVGVAYHLSQAITVNRELKSPLKVVILEARDFCAGATGRNGGHLTPAAFWKIHARTAKYGPEEAKRSYAVEAHTASSLIRIIQDNGWVDDVDLVDGGHVDLLFTKERQEQMRHDLDAAEKAGLPLEDVVTLSQDQVEATFGAHYPAVRIPGHNLWPLKLVTKLYQQAKSRVGSQFDLVLHTNTPVTAIEPSTDTTRAYTLSTPRGTINCSRIVHATNGYVSHHLPFLAGPQGIVPVRGQIIATRASVGANEIKTNSWAGINSEHSEYWFPRPAKLENENPLIILGGARETALPALEAYVDDDTTCHSAVGETLRAFLPSIFEGKFEPEREPEMEWTGIMGYTAIGDPFVGPVDRLPSVRANDDANKYAHHYIAAGYSGHGMPRAFACAEVVAQMIVADLEGKEWVQPEWFPTRYLTWEERETETVLRN